MKLQVKYQDVVIGTLASTSNKGIVFTYSQHARRPISVSMPRLDIEYGEKECLPFFDGLLPEGPIRRQIADLAHVPYTSTMKLLDSYGEEIAGAFSLVNEEYEGHGGINGYKEISIEEIQQKINSKDRMPLIYEGKVTKLSLAGAENKIPVYYTNNQFFLPQGNSPSNYIIKACDEFVQNEYICTKLASLCNLRVSEMEIHNFFDAQALLIKRYDRINSEENLTRLHQEDFCQALGIMPENKYEQTGGPSLEKSIELIRTFSSQPENDFKQFLMMIIFNFLIGNCDAHGKNYSFLYNVNLEKMALAPFYDIVCTSIYKRFDKKMAMKIHHENLITKITKQSFESAMPKKLIRTLINEMLERFPLALQQVMDSVSPNLHPILIAIGNDSIMRQTILKS